MMSIWVTSVMFLMFVDPCIIVQFLQWKIQQDATVYQNFIIPYFKWSSTRFGRHTAHHQEHKTPQAASGFAYVEGCRTCSCWTFSGSVWEGALHLTATWQRPTTARRTAFHVCKTRGCLWSFRLLMMGGVSPETCWASFKIRNTKILLHYCILLVFHCKNVCYIFMINSSYFLIRVYITFHLELLFRCTFH